MPDRFEEFFRDWPWRDCPFCGHDRGHRDQDGHDHRHRQCDDCSDRRDHHDNWPWR